MEDIDIATITKRSVHGVIALMSRTFFLQLISFATRIVIYTMLLAQEVGMYTAVIAIQRVIGFFTDFGLGAALIQKKEQLVQEDLETSFTLQASITLAIFLLVFLLRDTLAAFFRLNDAGLRLLLALVFSLFLSSFKVIPSILLERSIRFSRLVIPQVAESLTFNAVLIFLILKNFGLDSYTFAFLSAGLVGIPFYFAVSPWRIRIGIHRESISHLHFGLQFQAKNILATIKDDLLTVILVRFLSFTQIGYIGFAQGLAFFVYRYIVDSVTKVTFSTYSRIQENAEHMRKAIEKSLFFVSAALFPILTGLIITSPYIISYFPKWQHKWEPAIISLIFFCLNALVSSISGILVNVLDATGRVKTTLKLMVLWTILTWILTPLLIYFFGFSGVAIASFLVTLTVFITIRLVKQIVDFQLIRSIKNPALCSFFMGVCVYLLGRTIITNFAMVLFVILIGGCLYIVSFYLLAKKELLADAKIIFRQYEQ